MTRPLALTMGDPAGIGPELTAKLALKGTLRGVIYVGNAAQMRGLAPDLNIAITDTFRPDPAADLTIFDLDLPANALAGQPNLRNASATIRAIEIAVNAALNGAASGVVTNPISKAILKDGAGFAYPGHTEFLGALCGVDMSVMMLAGPDLRVVPVTIHIPLAEVPSALTPELLRETILITRDALIQDFGVEAPRLCVAGLNPHAGEDGKIGSEEITLITPVLDALRAEGIDVLGPRPADTMFHAAARAEYDAAICMYHDQALAPLKALSFDEGVNITLGLPIIRTSPDHGTAFGIAGKGAASETSLQNAITTARDMARQRKTRS